MDAVQQHHHLRKQTNYECTESTQFDEGRLHGPRLCGCDDGSCIERYQRHAVRVLSALCLLGCLVYGAFVAAVAAMVSGLSWVCLGCLCFSSFLATRYCLIQKIFCEDEKT